MSWREEWKALRERIRGLIEAGDVYARLAQVGPSDFHRGAQELRRQGSDIYDLVDELCEKNPSQIPLPARQSLRRWTKDHKGLFTSRPPSSGVHQDQMVVTAMLPFLAALETEVSYHLTDRQQQIRLRSERAFSHLQRSIAADPEVQKRWRGAYNEGEVSCEKLGAAHLLLHGIWAFKVNAQGAQTDLVFQEALESHQFEMEQAAEGLVLTEWKKVRPSDDLHRKINDARDQAARYASGALGGMELTDYRYLVVVTKDLVKDLPSDQEQDGVVYRHVNIAVDPKTPSKA